MSWSVCEVHAERMSSWVFGQPSPTAIFCPHCQSILNLPDVHLYLVCPDCGFREKLSNMTLSQASDSKTESKAHFDAAAVNAPTTSSGDRDKSKFKRATVKESCPNCNNDTMTFYTLQLRSADEGQTVFYECLKCGHSYSTNTWMFICMHCVYIRSIQQQKWLKISNYCPILKRSCEKNNKICEALCRRANYSFQHCAILASRPSLLPTLVWTKWLRHCRV